MKLIGVLLISLIPIIIGIKKYMILLNKANISKRIFEIFHRLLDEIKYTQKELRCILKKENEDFFIFANPIFLNEKKLTENGFKTEEIAPFKDFLKVVQSGDKGYIFSQGEVVLKIIEGVKIKSEKELVKTGRLYITVFLGLSAVVFLALI